MMKGIRAKAGILLALSLLLSIVLPVAADEPPRLPSGFYGTAKQNGANVPNGTIVSASINGVEYAQTTTFLTTINSVQVSVYTITVPGDDPSTPGVIEGGNEGDTIVFKIGIHPTDQTGTWHEGTDTELNLHATVNTPPTTVSVSPTGYNSMPDFFRTFESVYQDVDGWQDLRDVYLMWNTSANGNTQQLRFEVLTRKFYVRNDANTDWVGGFVAGTSTPLSNTSFSLDLTQSSVVTTTTQVRVTWSLMPKQPATSVNWNVYLKAEDSRSQSTGWVNRGTWRVNMFPNVGGVSPASGNAPAGTPQVFSVTYSDEDGATTLGNAFIRATMQQSPYTEQFKAYYNRGNNRMYAYNGSSWVGGLTPGTPGTIDTPNAILDVGASSVNVGAKVLTVNWSITFKTGTDGVKDIWGYIYDNQVFQEGYVLMGNWVVGSGAVASEPQGVAPQAEDPIPLDAPPDFKPIYRTPEMDPNSPLSGMIAPDRVAKGAAPMPLMPDAAPAPSKPNALPQITLPKSGNLPTGTPVAGIFSPTQGNRAPGWGWNFRAQFSDPSGYSHLAQVYVLFSMTGSTQNAIYVRYDQNTNRVYLRDSGDTTWIGGYTPGSSVKLSNKNGTIDVAKTTVATYSGNYLDFDPEVIFKGLGQSQHYRIFMSATDDEGNALDPVEVGWHRVNMWAADGGVTPSASSHAVGTTAAYTTTYTDPEQWSDLKYVFLNIAASAAGKTQALYAYYAVATNQIRMTDDSGAWIGPITPGTAQDLQNSWVIIHGAGTSVSTTGDKVSVTWSIEFKPTLGGTTKNIYLYAQDKLDWIDSWKQVGQVQITP